MGQILCKRCASRISLVASPNKSEGYIITDLDHDTSEGKDAYEFIMDASRDVVECECGALAISYPEKNDGKVKWYYPEDGLPEDLMSKQYGR